MNKPSLVSVEASNPVKAIAAIAIIRELVSTNYPSLAANAQSKLIMECLLEITEEERLLRA